jgi:hypothetical protein
MMVERLGGLAGCIAAESAGVHAKPSKPRPFRQWRFVLDPPKLCARTPLVPPMRDTRIRAAWPLRPWNQHENSHFMPMRCAYQTLFDHA